jgi:putative transcriptional regulator
MKSRITMSSNSTWPEWADASACVAAAYRPQCRRRHRGGLALLLLFASFVSGGPVEAQEPEPAPAAGMFLVASRDLQVPFFTRSVILLLQYDRSGAMGLIVNRPTEAVLSDAIPATKGHGGDRHHLHFGGPVSVQSVLYITRSSEALPSGVSVLEDLQVSGHLSSLQALLADSADAVKLKVFAGYSGWAPGQLEAEIQRGGWHVMPASAEQVFEPDGERLWRDLAPPPAPLSARLTYHDDHDFIRPDR